jgi:hypothetical protein
MTGPGGMTRGRGEFGFQDVVASKRSPPTNTMEKEDEQYFSASDPESYLMRNFENLDDDMSMDVASFVLLLIGAVRATAATETVYVASDYLVFSTVLRFQAGPML